MIINNSFHSLEELTLENTSNYLKPIVKTELLKMPKLKKVCLKEQIIDETVSEYDASKYLSEGTAALSIKMKVCKPKDFNLILDYKYYNFEFK